MSKLIFTLILFLTTSVFLTHSISVINNVTVSSNLFQDEFLKKMRLDFNISGITSPEYINNQKCVLQFQEIVNQFPSFKVAPFFDSWGKFPSGLLYGHFTDLGNYDECVKTSVELNKTVGIITGKYCMANVPLISPLKFSENDLSLLLENPLETKVDLQGFIKLRIGVCIPDTCSTNMITQIFQRVLADVLNGTLSGITVSVCSVAKKPEYEALDIFAMSFSGMDMASIIIYIFCSVLFSTFGGLMVLSTFYDCLSKKPRQLLLAFSVISNGRKLFMFNTKKSPNSIECLTGIRVLSLIWVLHCHNYILYPTEIVTNTVNVLSTFKKLWSMGVLMGSVSVDSFFLVSGVLVAWLGLQELDKTKGKLNVAMMYVHRFIRLTPALAAVLLFYVSLNKFIGNGPLWERYFMAHGPCEETWWATLLYIQNYATPNKMCVAHSWYLAIDTQLYVLSPLILIPLWKWGKKFVPVLVLLSLLSIGCTIATFFSRGYTSLIGFGEPERLKTIYFPTHTRYSVWIVGICCGYFMHLNRQKSMRPRMVLRLLGWIVCLGTILSIIFGPYFLMNSSQTASVGHAAAYESLKHVFWSLALAWIVVACQFGFGGIVNSILSHPFWQPLGRLTYCMYLVHMGVQLTNFGTVRTDVYFSDYTLFLTFWSTFGITVLVSIVLSLSFEAPVIVIEKVLFAKKYLRENMNGASPPNKVYMDESDSKQI